MSRTNTAATHGNGPAGLSIEKLVYGGEGLARSDGQAVLVPYVLPGERVMAEIAHVKAGLLRASRPQILQASEQRVLPRCEYFANCGGCHYQHAEYAFQLEQKRAILRETLQRLGGIVYDADIRILSGEPWFYRNRIQLHFANREAGFHKAGSRDLCAIDRCYISSPLLVDLIAKFKTAVKEPQWPEFLRSLEIFTNEREVQLHIVDSMRPVAARFFEWCSTFIPSLAHDAIDYCAAGRTYRISRGSFFQVNRFLIDSLVQEVIGSAAGRRVIDLYAGVGLFSLALAERFDLVEAVERGGPAYRDLEWNAAQNSANVRPVKASAEDFLRATHDAPELVVADPPRAGLGAEATALLLRLAPPNVTLVSCDPATLSRDLKKLLALYRIETMTLLDLFPQTYHFEVVVHLKRSSA